MHIVDLERRSMTRLGPAFQRRLSPAPPLSRSSDPCALGFALFILLNAVLFIRPSELMSDLAQVPIYFAVVILCCIASLPVLLQRLRPSALKAHPIDVCVLLLVPAIIFSQVTHLQFRLSLTCASEFSKSVVYYFLLVSLLTSVARFRIFFFFLVGFVVLVACLAMLQYYHEIDISALRPVTDEVGKTDAGVPIIIYRMRGTGFFNDPNDLCLILIVAMGMSCYWLTDRAAGPFRLVWLLPLGLFGFALALTHSRGGFLAMLSGMVVLFQARFGWRKTLPFMMVGLPAMFLFFAGRQTDINVGEGTGQERIHYWRDGLVLFKQFPIFGIGYGEFETQMRRAAHNSFVNGFVELGIVGGTLFTGIFWLAAWPMYRLQGCMASQSNPELARLRQYVLAIVAATGIGILFLSRNYVAPTYMVVGLAAAYLCLPGPNRFVELPRLSGKTVLRVGAIAFCVLAGHYLVIRLLAQ